MTFDQQTFTRTLLNTLKAPKKQPQSQTSKLRFLYQFSSSFAVGYLINSSSSFFFFNLIATFKWDCIRVCASKSNMKNNINSKISTS